MDCQTVREYTYAYGALCPDDGALDSLILPSMHSECFGHFVSEISRRHPEELIVMVCDGAGSHTATNPSLPENVRILTLPPYSPELNPTEQLWDLIRERRFANKAYDSLDESRRRPRTGTTRPRSRPHHNPIPHQPPMDHVVNQLGCGLV